MGRKVLSLTSVFDQEKLKGLLRDFYLLSHIRITLFDKNLEEIVSYPEQRAPFCMLIRKTTAGYRLAAIAIERLVPTQRHKGEHMSTVVMPV